MESSNNSNYYSLNLGTIEIKKSRQSFYRVWNRLHRLQKTVIILVLFLLLVYVLTHVEFHRKHIKNISDKHLPHDNIDNKNYDDNLKNQNEIEDIKQQEFDQNRDAILNVGPRNRKKLKHGLTFKGPTTERQKSVVNAFLFAWNSYKKHAWGEDELRPVTKTSSRWFGLGLTIVDSLDTIYIMGLKEQFKEARDWVATSFNPETDSFNNLFEITIRILAGFLSAYHLSGDRVFLDKAYDLGNRSLPAFQTRSSIPLSDINLKKREARGPHWTSDSSLSEASTIQVEFKDLSYITGDLRFKEAVMRTSQALHDLDKPDGLAPIYINVQTGKFSGQTITLGARGDSYYEYLLKQWIQNGAKFDKNDDHYFLLEDWLVAIKGIKEKLVKYTKPNNLAYVGELISGSFYGKMDHLVCFLPGNIALGAMYLAKNPSSFKKDETDELLKLAEALTETCYQMYEQMETGLSPEIVYFNSFEGSTTDLYVKDNDRHNLLRPETIESLYYLYKITKNKKYQEYGWKIFQAFEKYTKIETGGYSSISDVKNINNVRYRDKMESFFLAETLKYFYLLFEDENTFENVNFNKWIFNSEAHLLPIYHN